MLSQMLNLNSGNSKKEVGYMNDFLPYFCFCADRNTQGGTIIFSYICRLQPFFGGSKFGFFRKMNIFGGMKILWIFFGVITKLD